MNEVKAAPCCWQSSDQLSKSPILTIAAYSRQCDVAWTLTALGSPMHAHYTPRLFSPASRALRNSFTHVGFAATIPFRPLRLRRRIGGHDCCWLRRAPHDDSKQSARGDGLRR